MINVHLFPANLGGSACSSEIVQAVSAVRQFGGGSGMTRHAAAEIGCTFTEFHGVCPYLVGKRCILYALNISGILLAKSDQ